MQQRKRSNKRAKTWLLLLGLSSNTMVDCTGLWGGAGGGASVLPVDRQVQPVEGGVEGAGRGRVQLQLGQQGEVVRGDVWVGAAGDAVVDQPIGVQRAHEAQDTHVGPGEEDVVDDALRTREGAGIITHEDQIQRSLCLLLLKFLID